jgi:hypothetical protein
MSLDYQFAPIDVNIAGHPRAWAAGVEAMGLWLWGMAHARQQKTGGHLSRPAVLGAWGGKRNIMLAKRLVDAGLWVTRDDGDWDIHNFERKTSGNGSAATRAKRYRDRKRDASGVTSDVTEASPVTRDASRSPSMSMSSSVSSSVSNPGSRPASDGPPEWFGSAVDVVAMGTGVALPVPEAWLRYDGHRAGKGIAPNAKDAQYWLTTVMVPEHREVLRRTARDQERDVAFRKDRAPAEVKALPSVTPLVRERERWEREAATPEQSAAAAANLRKLLGGVGT